MFSGCCGSMQMEFAGMLGSEPETSVHVPFAFRLKRWPVSNPCSEMMKSFGSAGLIAIAEIGREGRVPGVMLVHVGIGEVALFDCQMSPLRVATYTMSGAEAATAIAVM